MMMQGCIGIVVLLLICWLCSEQRRQINWRQVLLGLAVQVVLGLLLLRVPLLSQALASLNHLVDAVEGATRAGTTFLFGYLGGGDFPFEISEASATYLFAFRVLPQVVVFSAIVAILWHWRILPAIVRGFGWVLRRTLKVSGVLGTAGAASLFLGMVETPLLIRAYLARLSRSEFFTVMTFGMSTVAGSVMILYASLLDGTIPNVVGHLLSASLINVVGAIYISRILIPQPDEETTGPADTQMTLSYQSTIDALTRGTSDGLQLAMNVGAMLLVFISMVALVNGLLGVVDVQEAPLSLQRILGWVFAPVAWMIGIPWQDAVSAGGLLGTKLVLNEVVAFLQLAETGAQYSEQTRLVMLYALCGFANFGSLGILLGGLSTLIPERRIEFLQIAPRSLLSGTIVTLITGAIAGLVA